MKATAPGKLILTGEYAVLEGAPAIVVGVDRRVSAIIGHSLGSPFLSAVRDELRAQGREVAALKAGQLAVESDELYSGEQKLGLGSSAAVTVAATALALELAAAEQRAEAMAAVTTDGWQAVNVLSTVASETRVPVDRELVLAIASAAHAHAQAERGSRGSGADVAAAVYGGVIEFTAGKVRPLEWPNELALITFFTGVSASTGPLVRDVMGTRPTEALAEIRAASLAAIAQMSVAAFARCADAFDALAAATKLPLVPACVTAAREAMAAFGGTAKTTGAGGGDVAVAIVPATADRAAVEAEIARAGGQVLPLQLDRDGVRLT